MSHLLKSAPWLLVTTCLVCLAGLSSCGGVGLFPSAATLGGDVPGGRGEIRVSFINDTPYRAIFTYGTYDPFNQNVNSNLAFPPRFDQFFADTAGEARLEGNSESSIITFDCGRTMSVGGAPLIRRIYDFELDDGRNLEALKEGIAFSSTPVNEEGAEQSTAVIGGERVPGIENRQGFEYPCEALLVYTFQLDLDRPACQGAAPLPRDCFLIDFDVILP